MKKVLVLLGFLFVSITYAQVNSSFSSETIQKFADAYTEVRNENMTLQLNMITAIEDAGLTSDQFTKIHMQLKDTKSVEQPSEMDKRKYNVALGNIEELNKGIQESIERIIVKNGLKVETYHSIAKASQSDEALKRKIQQYME